MVAITGSAVLLAARLDARILAALAWIGGYMTPMLLSTGEDKALALFLFLAVLDTGALILDHRRPWPGPGWPASTRPRSPRTPSIT